MSRGDFMTIKKSKTTPRRPPQQTRGKERVEHILKVTEKLLLKKGYDAINTNAIAAEAGISIGSLYHFFPNKLAILEALIARYYEQYLEVLEEVHSDKDADFQVEKYIKHLFHALIRFDQAVPSSVPAFIAASKASPNLEAMDLENAAQVNQILSEFYRAKGLDKKWAIRVSRMVRVILDAFFIEVAEKDAKTSRELVEEVKKVLTAYLKTYFL